ncbi:MAG TPA: TIR domain-containing protein [Solimonas sp.]|nr:TIR domain-containing protein [Solimonas sp.]
MNIQPELQAPASQRVAAAASVAGLAPAAMKAAPGSYRHPLFACGLAMAVAAASAALYADGGSTWQARAMAPGLAAVLALSVHWLQSGPLQPAGYWLSLAWFQLFQRRSSSPASLRDLWRWAREDGKQRERAAWFRHGLEFCGPAATIRLLSPRLFSGFGLLASLALALLSSQGLDRRLAQALRATPLEDAAPLCGVVLGCLLGAASLFLFLGWPHRLATARMEGRLDRETERRILGFGASWPAMLVLLALGAVLNSADTDAALNLEGILALIWMPARVDIMVLIVAAGLSTLVYAQASFRDITRSDGARELLVVVPDSGSGNTDRSDGLRLLLHALCVRWTTDGRGPVTLIAPPAADLVGEHLEMTAATGREKLLFPNLEVQIGDWSQTVPPPERWLALPVRQLHPSPSLLYSALRILHGGSAGSQGQGAVAVLLLTDSVDAIRKLLAAIPLSVSGVAWLGAPENAPSFTSIAIRPIGTVASLDDAAALARELLDSDRFATKPAPVQQSPATAAEIPSVSLEPTDVAGKRAAADSDKPSPVAQTVSPKGSSSAPSLQAVPLHTLRHSAGVRCAAFSPDGQCVVTAGDDGSARIWNAQTGTLMGKSMKHGQGVATASFSSDGQKVVTASDDGSAIIWDAESGKALGEPLLHGSPVTAAAFSPDGRQVATASMDHTAKLWDAASGTAPGAPLKHELSVSAVAFSPDGGRLLTASGDRSARLWDAATGAPLGTPMQHASAVHAAAFSPDGQRIVTASADGVVQLWDAATGQPLGDPMKHRDTTRAAAFSPEGRRLVIASDAGTVYVRDAASGAPIVEPLQHRHIVSSVSFSPDGARVLTSSLDNTAVIWSLPRTEQPSDSRPPRIFVSYYSGYREYTSVLVEAMQKLGLEVMHDRDLRAGDPLDETLTRMLDQADVFVAIVGSVTASRPMPMREINRAFEQGKTIIPVMVDHFEQPEMLLKFYAANTEDGQIRYLSELSGKDLAETLLNTARRIQQAVERSDSTRKRT